MLRLLDQLDQRQLRLGTFNAIAHVAGRQIDSRSALLRRFQRFFFRKIRPSDTGAAKFRANIDAAEWRDLEAKATSRQGKWLYIAELWLADRQMPSHVGPFDEEEKRAAVFLDLARQLGLLNKTFALTEVGAVLKSILPPFKDGEPEPNPLLVAKRIREQALYTFVLLQADILTPFLLRQLADDPGASPGTAATALLRAASELLEKARKKNTLSQALAVRNVWAYQERLKEHEKAREHNVRPRLEFFVDLGLLSRSGSKEAGAYPLTRPGRMAAREWQRLVEHPDSVGHFLETEFFVTFARIHGIGERRLIDREQRLLAFAQAFPGVCRTIGYTPGRTVALAACLANLAEGVIVEIDELVRAVRESALTPLGRWLQFSGGSRFDRELLIRVEPGLAACLLSGTRKE